MKKKSTIKNTKSGGLFLKLIGVALAFSAVRKSIEIETLLFEGKSYLMKAYSISFGTGIYETIYFLISTLLFVWLIYIIFIFFNQKKSTPKILKAFLIIDVLFYGVDLYVNQAGKGSYSYNLFNMALVRLLIFGLYLFLSKQPTQFFTENKSIEKKHLIKIYIFFIVIGLVIYSFRKLS